MKRKVFIASLRSPFRSRQTQQFASDDCIMGEYPLIDLISLLVVNNPGNVRGQERPKQILLLNMTCSKVQMMASTATMRIIPSTAACILSLAAPIESLSPPEVIHPNAPRRR